MDPRVKKQIIISSVFILVILIIAFGVYFFYFRETPTCSDNIKNQGEEGIDCGGPCVPCELKNLKNIEISWAKALPTQNQNYDLVARIKNVNQNEGSREFSYEFQLYNLNNKLIASRSGTNFILSREEKYIIEQKVFTPETPAIIKLNIGQTNWEKISDYNPPALQVFDKKFESSNEIPIFWRASAIVKNSSYSVYKSVKIAIVLFDAKDEPLAVNLSELDKIDAGQERYFSAPWHFSFVGSVAKVDVETYVDLFK